MRDQTTVTLITCPGFAEDLHACLKSLLPSLKGRPFIVVENGTDEETTRVFETFSIVPITLPAQPLTVVQNLLVSKVATPDLILLHPDIIIEDENWIDQLELAYQAHTDPTLMLLGVRNVPGFMFIVKKAYWEQIGGADTVFDVTHWDIDVQIRFKKAFGEGSVVYSNTLPVFHHGLRRKQIVDHARREVRDGALFANRYRNQ
jgi:hypothetical protein